MTIDYAINVLINVRDHLIFYVCLTDSFKREILEALNLAISALKTINDMNTQGEEHDNA